MLNAIWIGFFLIAFVTGLIKWIVLGDGEVFGRMMLALFELSKTAFDIALGLTGVLALWLGILRIGERSGFIAVLTAGLTPLFKCLMPEVPGNHPALGAMVMNIAANVLGLDNAATPMGIKAMKELQAINPDPNTATNAQILFLVINTSSVTLFPVTIFTYRAQLGASNPTDVFIPILIATYVSTLCGFLAVAAMQRINLLDRVILAYLGGISALVGAVVYHFAGLDQDAMQAQSALLSNLILFTLVILFIGGAVRRRVDAYEAFIEGAKDGFQTAVMIVPYLVAMLVAIGVFRASGALDLLADIIRHSVAAASLDGRFVDALPTALIKPFSGSGARAMMVDTMQTFGADSFPGRLASIVQGSTETTFYVLAVYFGAAGIKNVRHAVGCGIIADFGGVLAAIGVAYWFFG